jgi:hypothetical protein
MKNRQPHNLETAEPTQKPPGLEQSINEAMAMLKLLCHHIETFRLRNGLEDKGNPGAVEFCSAESTGLVSLCSDVSQRLHDAFYQKVSNPIGGAR